MKSVSKSLLTWLLSGVFSFCSTTSYSQEPVSISLSRWAQNKTAAFVLMFDDSYPSHVLIVVPELKKRDMIATFYLNPGKSEYKKYAQAWESTVKDAGMVYGDHTMTHTGVKDIANAEYEIGECARIIRSISYLGENKLISFGRPGLAPGQWNISSDEFATLLRKYNLIERPTFDKHGAVYHMKTTESMLALADKAIATKDMEYLVIHGVERIGPEVHYQDFWALKQDIFLPLLDGLKDRRDRGDLWITDHISAYQYAIERDSASIKILEQGERIARISLTSAADPQLYDHPLTLLAHVPDEWKQVRVSQGANVSVKTARNNTIQFDAVAGLEDILLAPVSIQ